MTTDAKSLAALKALIDDHRHSKIYRFTAGHRRLLENIYEDLSGEKITRAVQNRDPRRQAFDKLSKGEM